MGSLDSAYLARLERILDTADDLGMVVILGYFYFGQDQRLAGEVCCYSGGSKCDGLAVSRGYTNVLIEIGNEVDNRAYNQDIIRAHRCHELIDLVKRISIGKVASPSGRLLVSASLCGNVIPPDNIVGSLGLSVDSWQWRFRSRPHP